jgi:hypothetical protein
MMPTPPRIGGQSVRCQIHCETANASEIGHLLNQRNAWATNIIRLQPNIITTIGARDALRDKGLEVRWQRGSGRHERLCYRAHGIAGEIGSIPVSRTVFVLLNGGFRSRSVACTTYVSHRW